MRSHIFPTIIKLVSLFIFVFIANAQQQNGPQNNSKRVFYTKCNCKILTREELEPGVAYTRHEINGHRTLSTNFQCFKLKSKDPSYRHKTSGETSSLLSEDERSISKHNTEGSTENHSKKEFTGSPAVENSNEHSKSRQMSKVSGRQMNVGSKTRQEKHTNNYETKENQMKIKSTEGYNENSPETQKSVTYDESTTRNGSLEEENYRIEEKYQHGNEESNNYKTTSHITDSSTSELATSGGIKNQRYYNYQKTNRYHNQSDGNHKSYANTQETIDNKQQLKTGSNVKEVSQRHKVKSTHPTKEFSGSLTIENSNEHSKNRQTSKPSGGQMNDGSKSRQGKLHKYYERKENQMKVDSAEGYKENSPENPKPVIDDDSTTPSESLEEENYRIKEKYQHGNEESNNYKTTSHTTDSSKSELATSGGIKNQQYYNYQSTNRYYNQSEGNHKSANTQETVDNKQHLKTGSNVKEVSQRHRVKSTHPTALNTSSSEPITHKKYKHHSGNHKTKSSESTASESSSNDNHTEDTQSKQWSGSYMSHNNRFAEANENFDDNFNYSLDVESTEINANVEEQHEKIKADESLSYNHNKKSTHFSSLKQTNLGKVVQSKHERHSNQKTKSSSVKIGQSKEYSEIQSNEEIQQQRHSHISRKITKKTDNSNENLHSKEHKSAEENEQQKSTLKSTHGTDSRRSNSKHNSQKKNGHQFNHHKSKNSATLTRWSQSDDNAKQSNRHHSNFLSEKRTKINENSEEHSKNLKYEAEETNEDSEEKQQIAEEHNNHEEASKHRVKFIHSKNLNISNRENLARRNNERFTNHLKTDISTSKTSNSNGYATGHSEDTRQHIQPRRLNPSQKNKVIKVEENSNKIENSTSDEVNEYSEELNRTEGDNKQYNNASKHHKVHNTNTTTSHLKNIPNLQHGRHFRHQKSSTPQTSQSKDGAKHNFMDTKQPNQQLRYNISHEKIVIDASENSQEGHHRAVEDHEEVYEETPQYQETESTQNSDFKMSISGRNHQKKHDRQHNQHNTKASKSRTRDPIIYSSNLEDKKLFKQRVSNIPRNNRVNKNSKEQSNIFSDDKSTEVNENSDEVHEKDVKDSTEVDEEFSQNGEFKSTHTTNPKTINLENISHAKHGSNHNKNISISSTNKSNGRGKSYSKDKNFRMPNKTNALQNRVIDKKVDSYSLEDDVSIENDRIKPEEEINMKQETHKFGVKLHHTVDSKTTGVENSTRSKVSSGENHKYKINLSRNRPYNEKMNNHKHSTRGEEDSSFLQIRKNAYEESQSEEDVNEKSFNQKEQTETSEKFTRTESGQKNDKSSEAKHSFRTTQNYEEAKENNGMSNHNANDYSSLSVENESSVGSKNDQETSINLNYKTLLNNTEFQRTNQNHRHGYGQRTKNIINKSKFHVKKLLDEDEETSNQEYSYTNRQLSTRYDNSNSNEYYTSENISMATTSQELSVYNNSGTRKSQPTFVSKSYKESTDTANKSGTKNFRIGHARTHKMESRNEVNASMSSKTLESVENQNENEQLSESQTNFGSKLAENKNNMKFDANKNKSSSIIDQGTEQKVQHENMQSKNEQSTQLQTNQYKINQSLVKMDHSSEHMTSGSSTNSEEIDKTNSTKTTQKYKTKRVMKKLIVTSYSIEKTTTTTERPTTIEPPKKLREIKCFARTCDSTGCKITRCESSNFDNIHESPESAKDKPMDNTTEYHVRGVESLENLTMPSNSTFVRELVAARSLHPLISSTEQPNGYELVAAGAIKPSSNTTEQPNELENDMEDTRSSSNSRSMADELGSDGNSGNKSGRKIGIHVENNGHGEGNQKSTARNQIKYEKAPNNQIGVEMGQNSSGENNANNSNQMPYHTVPSHRVTYEASPGHQIEFEVAPGGQMTNQIGNILAFPVQTLQNAAGAGINAFGTGINAFGEVLAVGSEKVINAAATGSTDSANLANHGAQTVANAPAHVAQTIVSAANITTGGDVAIPTATVSTQPATISTSSNGQVYNQTISSST